MVGCREAGWVGERSLGYFVYLVELLSMLMFLTRNWVSLWSGAVFVKYSSPLNQRYRASIGMGPFLAMTEIPRLAISMWKIVSLWQCPSSQFLILSEVNWESLSILILPQLSASDFEVSLGTQSEIFMTLVEFF